MQTGDGLLVRLIPQQPISIAAFVAVCEASESCGNGIVEITQRGSLQIRGLTTTSVPRFAQAVARLDIAHDGVPVLTSPLHGFDPLETDYSRSLTIALRETLRERSGAPLSAKVSVLIDTAGKLHLDAVTSDIRLRASECGRRFHISVGGDARNATALGWVDSERIIAAVSEILDLIADQGPAVRARDLTPQHLSVLQEHLKSDPQAEPGPQVRQSCEPLGIHAQRDGRVTFGCALAFGHATAGSLRRLAYVAADCGASALRPAPARAMLAFGLSREAACELCAAAEALGFVVEAGDSRRFVVACAGAPACSSATLATRQLAPEVAAAAQGIANSSKVIHLSGCTKGCAHPGPAALTIAGPDLYIVGGRAGDAPAGRISSSEWPACIERICQDLGSV